MAENVIRIMCPNLMCRSILAVPATARGRIVRCKGCATNIRIPQADASKSKQQQQQQTPQGDQQTRKSA